MHTTSINVSSTIPEELIENSSLQDIQGYNQDLEAYLKYVQKGGKLNDGVVDIQEDVIVAVAPPRKNKVPWFGRVTKIDYDGQEATVRWMEKTGNNAVYFYLTDNSSQVHFETVICNGVDFEPILNSTLMWRLSTPLCFIQAMNADEPPQLIQQNAIIMSKKQRNKFDLSQMVFANAVEFRDFCSQL